MSSETGTGAEYLEPVVGEVPRPELLEDVESARSYCLRNGLKTGKSGDVYTGVQDGDRYFLRENPNRWDVASHMVADAFLQQYDIEAPEMDYVDGSIVMSSMGDPAIPVDSRKSEFLLRESVPNLLQPAKADPETVADSLFTHLAGGAPDITGNTVLADGTAYPIDFQGFGQMPDTDSMEGFLKRKGFTDFVSEELSYPEQVFSKYRDRLGFSMTNDDFRDHVHDRALDFEAEDFWSELQENLQGLEPEISEDAEEFAGNTAGNVEQLSGI